MSDYLNKAMRAEAQRMLDEVSNTRLGLVTSYDPDNYSVKVTLQPDNVETGWIPVASIAVGNGWGLYFPPAINDQVVVAFQEGDLDSAVATAFLYNDEDKPLSVKSGEWWMVHRSMTHVKFLEDGTLDIRGPNITAGILNEAVYRLVDQRFQALFNGHTHPTPSGVSGPPNQRLTDDHMTKSLKGG